MKESSTRPVDEITEIVQTYGDMLFRLCLVMLKNPSDAEDVVQETMLRYMQKSPVFRDSEHKKAWLITVASNKCKDILRYKRLRPQMDLEHIRDIAEDTDDSGIIEILMELPEKYKIVLMLYYVEEYSVNDIAGIINRTTSAVKMRLQKGRKLLAEKYREECL
ncbi:MAG: sigma-70 family RNA polymerase sigma factor [Ruminococcus sp.]|nr:sigma-70 family RNA polymerase sigma factor [Ruminococcus sp.]